MSPDLAYGLKPWFHIEHLQDIPELLNAPKKGDEPVIAWCRDNGAVWITGDKKARKQYQADLLASKISVLWVHGPPQGGFPSWLQFQIVVRVMDETHKLLGRARGALHMRTGVRGKRTPEVIWAEHGYDRPQSITIAQARRRS